MAIDIEALFRRFGPMVHRRCRRLLRSDEDARDAAQDVFVRLVSRSEDLNDEQMGGLLWTMATQVSLNRLRTRARKPESGPDLLEAIVAAADDPDERVGVGRVLALVFPAGERELVPSTRTLAVMRWVDGMTI